jgi:hypothetical protein
MQRPDIFVIYTFFIAIIFISSSFPQQSSAAECGTGKRPLFFAFDPKLSAYMPPGFGTNLFKTLDQPLQEIGYCLTRFNNSVYNDSTVQEELVMILSINLSISRKATLNDGEIAFDSTTSYQQYVEDTTAQVIVSLIAVNLWKTQERKRTLENPLVELAYSPEELTTFESMLIKKIVENLRTQYMCHLSIQSVPEGVHIRSINGLEGITPLEWITPLGKLPIIGELKGYEPFKRKIVLNAPGTYTYVLQMQHQQFFHSRFFRPTIILSATSVTSFVVMQYFHNRYDNFGEWENENNPTIFGNDFHTAKAFQIIAFSTLALAGASFTLCFYF